MNVEVYAKIESSPSWTGIGIDYLNASEVEISEKVVQITATAYSKYTISETVPPNTAKIRLWTWKSGTVGKAYLTYFESISV